jgi:hypothetical protein
VIESDRQLVTDSMADWTEKADGSTGKTYFYNTVTGESSWTDPNNPAAAAAAAALPARAGAHIAIAAKKMHPEGAGGGDDPEVVERVDPETGKPFFYNTKTNKSAWSKDEVRSVRVKHKVQALHAMMAVSGTGAKTPRGAAAAAAAAAARARAVPAGEALSRAERPGLGSAAAAAAQLPEHITEHQCPSTGKKYFYNTESGETTWRRGSIASSEGGKKSHEPRPGERVTPTNDDGPADDPKTKREQTHLHLAREIKAHKKRLSQAGQEGGGAGEGAEDAAGGGDGGPTIYRVNHGTAKDTKAGDDDESQRGAMAASSHTACCCMQRSFFLRRWCTRLTRNSNYESAMLLPIVANVVTLAAYDPVNVDSALNQQIDQLEVFFNAIFTIEMVIAIIANGFVGGHNSYLSRAWGRLDLLLVLIGWAPMALALMGIEASSFSAVRVIRVLKVLRTIKSIAGMPQLVKCLFDSLAMLVDVIYLLIFIFFIFGSLGVQLFAGSLHQQCYLPESYYVSSNVTSNDALSALPRFEGWQASHCQLPKDTLFTLPNSTFGHACSAGYTCRAVTLDPGGSVFNEDPNNGYTSFDNIAVAFLTIFQVGDRPPSNTH